MSNPSTSKPFTLNPKSLVKIGEASKLLGVSIDTLRRWEKSGKIKAIRTPGGTRLYSLQALGTINPQAAQTHQTASISTEELLKKTENQTVDNPTSTFQLQNPASNIQHPISKLVTKFLIGSAALSILTLAFTSLITASYFIQPATTQQLFKNNIASGVLSPFHALSQAAIAIIDPKKAYELGFTPPDNPPPIPYALNPKPSSNVLAVTSLLPFLEVNSDTQINGSLFVRDSINGMTLEVTGTPTLTVSDDATIDQDVSTSSSPAFSTLTLSSTTNQLSAGGANFTLPTNSTTLVGTDSTQTLTNKSMSGSSNTFTNIPNSALVNSKVTVSAGTNLSGGGDVNLGSSITLSLKDSPSISGQVLLADGTAAAPSLSFTNDTNTGLYRIGTDKIGLITAGSATSGITIDATGNLGIKTISPSYALDVTGTLRATGASTLQSTLGVSGTTTLSGAATLSSTLGVSGATTLSSTLDVSGTTTLSGATTLSSTLSVSGNVGIATSAAGSALQVNGATALGWGTAAVTGPANGLGVSGNVGIGTTSPNANLEILNNDGWAKLYLNAPTATSANFIAFYEGSTLNADMISTNSSGPDAPHLFEIRNRQTDGMIQIGNYQNAGFPAINISANNNVGIGTTNPGAKFAVYGNATIGFGNSAASPAGPTNGLAVSGNLGIGTTSPLYNLQVIGTTNITGVTTVGGKILASTGSLDIGSAGIRFGTGYFDTIDASNLAGVITGGGTENASWTINSDNNTDDTEDGNLAFERGTVTPNALLTWDSTNDEFDLNSTLNITGTISSTNGLILSGFVNDITTPGNEHLVLMPGGTGNVGIGWTSPTAKLNILQTGAADAFRVDDIANDTTPFVIDQGGNVGIGIASPTSALNVIGNVGIGTSAAGAALQVNGGGLFGWGTASRALSSGAIAAFNGNVGIGTTSPNYALDVNGTINATAIKTPYQHTIVVAKAGGDYTTIGDALTAITDNSSSNLYLIKIMPGTYSETVTMKQYVDIEGSGWDSTVITGADLGSSTTGVIVAASNSMIQNLTVNLTSTSASYENGIYAMSVSNFTVNNVKLLATSGAAYGPFGIFLSTTGTDPSYILNSLVITNNAASTSYGRALNIRGTGSAVIRNNHFRVTNNISGSQVFSTSGSSITVNSANNTFINDSGSGSEFVVGTTDTVNSYNDSYKSITVSGTFNKKDYWTDPLASTTQSVLPLGARAMSGLSPYGTYLGINSAAGYTGDFANFQVNGTSKFRIDANGNVGIGATNPTTGLYVTSNAMIGYSSGAPASLANGLAVSGNVGVGTTSPLANLHVEGQCVTGDTLLKRRKRRKKLEDGELDDEDGSLKLDEYEDVEIKDIEPGDEILTLDEKSGEFVVSKVNALMDMGIKQTFKLTTSSGKQIRTTANHPYLVKQQKTRLSASSLTAHTSDEVALDLRTASIPENNDFVKSGVEVTGIEPARTDFVDRAPHQSTPTNPLSQIETKWVKVSQLKNGMEIATINGWETITSIQKFKREQVFDIEVEGTHNFVGNNIVAHNTYISGNVGIGATSPNALLHLGLANNTTAAYGIQMGSDITLYRSAANTLKTDNSLTVAGSITQTGTGVNLFTGNVGIGTSAAGAALQVNGGGLFGWGTASRALSSGAIAAFNGNVGIGTTSPNYALDVNGTINATAIKTPYQHTIVVAKAGGDYTTIGDALTAITDNSSSNLYLIKVMPGTYSEQVTMKDYVDIEGSGQGITTITQAASGQTAGVVAGASNAKLSNLTVELTAPTGNNHNVIYASGETNFIVQNTHITATAVAPYYAPNGISLLNSFDGDIFRDNKISINANSQAYGKCIATAAGSSGTASVWNNDCNITNSVTNSVEGLVVAAGTINSYYNRYITGARCSDNGDILVSSGATVNSTYDSYTCVLNAGTFNKNDYWKDPYGAATQAVLPLGGRAFAAGSTSGTFLGINAPASFGGNYLDFKENGGASSLVFNSSGNLGIGFSSPIQLLDIYKTQSAPTRLTVRNPNTGTAAQSVLTAENGTSTAYLGMLGTGYTTSGGFKQDSAYLESDGTGGLSIISTNSSANMRFYTGGYADANERLTILSGGNVGIGTTSPTQLLSVGTGATSNFTVTSAGAVTAVGVTSSNNIRLTGGYQITSASHLYLTPDAGKVFIGNSPLTPGSMLSVTSGVSIGGNYYSVTAPDGGLLVQGNVGIGFTSPTASLHIVNTAAQDSFRVDDAANDTSPFIIDQNGNVGIGTVTPNSNLDVTTPLNGYVNFGRSLQNGEWTGIGFGYREDGNTLYRNAALVFEEKNIGGNGPGTIHILNADKSSGQGLADARMSITSTGNVGIGTTGPGGKLDVYGGVNIGNATFNTDYQLEIQPFVGGASYPLVIKDSAGANLWYIETSTGNVHQAGDLFLGGTNKIVGGAGTTSDLTLQTTSGVGTNGADMHFLVGNNGATEAMTILNNGNVGIGTTNPGNLFEVNGNARVTKLGIGMDPTNAFDINASAPLLSFYIDEAFAGRIGRGASVLTGTSTTGIAIRSEDTLALGAGGNNITMLLKTDGNVGIGTTDPGAKLEVNGNMYFSAGAQYGVRSLSVANPASGNADSLQIQGGIGSGSGSSGGGLWLYGGSGSNTGNTNGGQILITAGSAGNNADNTGNGGDVLVTAGRKGTAGSTEGIITLTTAGLERMRINASGNVGIGTTDPGFALEVNGNAAASAFRGNTNNVTLPIYGPSNTIGGGYILRLAPVGAISQASDVVAITAVTATMSQSGTAGYTGLLIDMTETTTGSGAKRLFDAQLNSNSKFFIDNTGNVGIGTSAAGAALQVNGGGLFGWGTASRALSSGAIAAFNGNVGIGTTSPAKAFEVVGDILLQNNTQLLGKNTSGSVTGLIKTTTNNLTELSTSHHAYFSNYLGVNATLTTQPASALSVNGNFSLGADYYNIAAPTNGAIIQGNVGIGTTNPNAKLSFGTTSAAQQILMYESGNDRGGFGIQSGELRNFIWSNAQNGFTFGTISNADGSTWTEKVRITTDGNVGIGYTSPTANLHIVNTAAQNSFRVDDIANDTTPFVIDQGGNVGIGTANIGTVNGTSFTTIPLHIYSSDAKYTVIDQSGVGGLLLNDSSQTANNRMWGLVFSEGAGKLSFDTFNDNGSVASKIMTFDRTGNVGIGNSAPSALLDITWSGADSKAIKLTRTDKQNYYFTVDGNNVLQIYDEPTGNARLSIQGSSGNVGIGSALPSTKLDVRENSDTLRSVLALYNSGAASDGTGASLDFYTSSSVYNTSRIAGLRKPADGINNNGRLAFYTMNAGVMGAKMLIKEDGNVGIGTTDPVYKLQVDGSDWQVMKLRSPDSSGLMVFEETGGDAGVRGYIGYANGDVFSAAGAGLTNNISIRSENALLLGAGGDSLIMTLNSGNVGIGFTSPTSKLHILQTGAADAFRVDDVANDSTPFVINQNGNVGIGTADPGNPMEISADGYSPMGLKLTGTGSVGSFLSLNATGTNGVAWAVGSTASSGGLGGGKFGIWNQTIGYVMGADTGGNVGIGGLAAVGIGANLNGATLVAAASGNVGIGFTSPDYQLELVDNTNTPTFGLSDDDITHGVTTIAQTDTFLKLTSLSTTVGGAQLDALADADGTALQIRGIQSANPTDTTPALKLIGAKASGTGVQDLADAETVLQIANNDNTAALSILGNGNVGVGIAAPAALLDVEGDADSKEVLSIESDSATTPFFSNYMSLSLSNKNQTDNNFSAIGFTDGSTAYSSGIWGIYTDHTNNYGELAFITQGTSGINERMRIGSNGNVGIGFTSPSASLHIVNTAAQNSFRVDDVANDTSPFVINQDGNVGIGLSAPTSIFQISAVEPTVRITSGNSVGSSLEFGPVGAERWTAIDAVNGSGSSLWNTYSGGGIAFTAGNNLRMIIDTDGNVGIGTTVPGSKLVVGKPGGTGNLTVYGTVATCVLGDTAGAVSCSSDARLKTDISSLGTSTLDDVMKLNPVNFKWLDPSKPQSTNLGFIAQEVQEIFPSVVHTLPDGYLGVDYAALVVPAIKAIQEQQAEIQRISSQFSIFNSQLSIDADGTLNVPKLKTGSIILDPSIATASAKISETMDDTIGIVQNDITGINSSAVYIDLGGEIASLEDRVESQESRIKELETVVAGIATPSAQQSSAVSYQSSDNQASDSASLTTDDRRLTTDLSLTPPDILLATGSLPADATQSALPAGKPSAMPMAARQAGATLASITVTSDATFSGQLAAYDLSISNTLKALGKTTLADTSIAGELTVDGTFYIENGSEINVLGTLYLQRSYLSDSLDIFDGKVTIDNNGNIKTLGKVTASEVITNKLTISTNTTSASSSATLAASIGTGLLPANSTSVTIKTVQINSTSKVFITPVGITDKVLAVTNIKEGESFDISVSSASSADIKFNWWIVETE